MFMFCIDERFTKYCYNIIQSHTKMFVKNIYPAYRKIMKSKEIYYTTSKIINETVVSFELSVYGLDYLLLKRKRSP